MAVTQFKQKPKPSMEQRNFEQPEDRRQFELGKMELVNLGGFTFGRAVFQPGWRWSSSVKPIAKTESCQNSHLSLHNLWPPARGHGRR